MEDRNKYSTSQLLNFVRDSYLERTSRPIYAIVFLLPFIIFYELGTILINTKVLSHYWQGRVLAFDWLQKFLELLGFSSKFAWVATPLVVIIILAALQLVSRKRWYFIGSDIWPMAVECILLAVPLIVLSLFLIMNSSAGQHDATGQLVNSAAAAQAGADLSGSSVTDDALPDVPQDNASQGKWRGMLANIVTGIGAGIYEELVFRLILICVLMIVFQGVFRFGQKNSIILSVLVSAALFSAHHNVIFLDGRFVQTEAFTWTEFVFRTIAGIYFAVLFAVRGFGITAGTHAFYDIIATTINTIFFQQ